MKNNLTIGGERGAWGEEFSGTTIKDTWITSQEF